MIDKWHTLRLLLQKFETTARQGGDFHHDSGRSSSAELNYQSERDYAFVLSKMDMLDELAALYEDAPLQRVAHQPTIYTGALMLEAPAGLYTLQWTADQSVALATIAVDKDGNRWLSPTNWVGAKPELLADFYMKIDHIESVAFERDYRDGPHERAPIPTKTYSITGRPVSEAPPGLYRVIWTGGAPLYGTSNLAALGSEDGRTWLAPTTWAAPEFVAGDVRPEGTRSGLYWSDIKGLEPVA